MDHLYDTEIKYGATCSNGSELLALLANFNCLLARLHKFLINFLRLGLDCAENVNQVDVIKQRALRVGKTLKQGRFEF